ncbi:MAG: MBL fold metallo-hydrolase [Candidatus Adiutrix sp.]|jgi:phosphoribosyl 1,2-cyclic phosphodiesterase|nr:MBL fold metallo-hydrolase [Candidatus Adiutrix sp.]
MKFCVLASGSRGNAVWVEEGGLAVLLDCGLSFNEFKKRAELAGLDPRKLGCVLVSHEHRDHISGLGPLARALKIPILANQGTREGAGFQVGKVQWQLFRTGDQLDFGPLKIRTLPISHDARDPVAFLVESSAGRLGLATDLGAPTELIRQSYRGLRALVLEFNHDYEKLMSGPYPWPLKQRVRSRTGHLANDMAAQLAAGLYHRDLAHLILAHLSETNNLPELALEAARRALNDALEPVAANQWRPTAVFEM